MNNETKLLLNEHSIKRHSKRLLEEIRIYNPEHTLSEAQNMFARVIGLNNWHEVKKILISDKALSTDDGLTSQATHTNVDLIAQLAYIKDEIYYYSEGPVFYKDNTKNICYLKTSISDQQIKDFLLTTWGDNALSKINEGIALDYPFSAHGEKYRVNATCGTKNDKQVIYLTIFKMNKKPLKFSDLIINNNVNPYIKKSYGLIIVSGRTGSGKTTFLNSLLNETGKNKNEIIMTYEAPIEYIYDQDVNVTQTEIGRHLLSFGDGVRNALRRHPTRVLIGELRDLDTFKGIVCAASSGIGFYTTDYQSSIFNSLLYYKSMSDTESLFKDFLNNLNMLINQKMIKSDINDQIIILQEFLVLSPPVVKSILSVIDNHEKLKSTVTNLIEANNGSIKNQIKRLENEKIISSKLALKLLKEN